MIATSHKLRRNAWGRFYVTDGCNGCGVCAAYAGCNFERSVDGSYYYVIQQPYDDWEAQSMVDALEACPKHAIRDDGDDA